MRHDFFFYSGELVPVDGDSFQTDPASNIDYYLAPQENINLVDEDVLIEAQECVSACEHCDESAEITFEYLLDEVTGCDSTTTDHLMCRLAKCPRCNSGITENTRVIAL